MNESHLVNMYKTGFLLMKLSAMSEFCLIMPIEAKLIIWILLGGEIQERQIAYDQQWENSMAKLC
jgi:hypothetical protein